LFVLFCALIEHFEDVSSNNGDEKGSSVCYINTFHNVVADITVVVGLGMVLPSLVDGEMFTENFKQLLVVI
jgi:hypothetical protein